ncbi:fibronectin type III-like domain-contianing protein [Lactobacillus sp. R2/2]|nr:fibronectin type III-like domain-contianing protein [Lactobacillus sp. R2/2]
MDFKKVEIKAHTEKTVNFNISPKQLTFFDNTGEKVLENGEFTLYIGSNSRDCLAQDFTLVD